MPDICRESWLVAALCRRGLGRVVGGEFWVGNSCTPVVDSCQCMAKPVQYYKVKKIKNLKKKKKRSEPHWPELYDLLTSCRPFQFIIISLKSWLLMWPVYRRQRNCENVLIHNLRIYKIFMGIQMSCINHDIGEFKLWK